MILFLISHTKNIQQTRFFFTHRLVLQKQHRTAIKHLERVLELSKEIGDNVGDADAYGTIADIYTEIGEFEKAALYYDKYISKMATDGSPV